MKKHISREKPYSVVDTPEKALRITYIAFEVFVVIVCFCASYIPLVLRQFTFEEERSKFLVLLINGIGWPSLFVIPTICYYIFYFEKGIKKQVIKNFAWTFFSILLASILNWSRNNFSGQKILLDFCFLDFISFYASFFLLLVVFIFSYDGKSYDPNNPQKLKVVSLNKNRALLGVACFFGIPMVLGCLAVFMSCMWIFDFYDGSILSVLYSLLLYYLLAMSAYNKFLLLAENGLQYSIDFIS